MPDQAAGTAAVFKGWRELDDAGDDVGLGDSGFKAGGGVGGGWAWHAWEERGEVR